MKPPSVKFLPLLIVFLCYCSLETNGQTIVFGPEKYTRDVGVTRTVTRTFSVEDPKGSFNLSIEKEIGETARTISAVIKLNGATLVEGEITRQEITKSVTLKQRNRISVELSGEPGSTIILTISPAVIYTLYTHPDEPRFMRAEFSDGKVVDYFGRKNSKGVATSLDEVSVIAADGQVSTYLFDEQSRVAEIRSPDGLKLKFKWDSVTAGVVTLVSPDGLNQVSAPIDFSNLRSSNHHPPRLQSISFNFDSSASPFVALERSLSSAAISEQSACVAAAKLISKACFVIRIGLGIPGARSAVCAALSGAIAYTGVGVAALPIVWKSCETVLMAVQLGCGLVAIGDLEGNADSLCAKVRNVITYVSNLVIGKGPLVSVSLQLSPTGSFSVGQTVSGSFSLTNRGRIKAVMTRVLIGGRVGGVCPNNVCPDFTPVPSNVTLAPGQTYNYSGTLKLPQNGTYTFTVAYQKPDGNWVNPVETENGTINKLSITVQSIVPRAVVSTSLRLSPNSGPYSVGQTLDGTFSLTNRGNANLVMNKVLIGGRVGGACPKNVCPDFSPTGSSITLGAGKTYNYSGTFTPSAAGSYTFTVAYQKTDGSWVNPVDPENGTVNRLNITVQNVQPKAVVSTSLRLAQGNGPFGVGQRLDGSFSVTNRGNADLVMKNVLIGGRVGGPCPNNVCPADFVPPPPYNSITLAPGKTYNYSGAFTPQRTGTYTFSVAYQKPDGSWVIPVDPENGTVNKLIVIVQNAQPKGVVSTSLRLSPNSATYSIGQTLGGTFSIANRGNANLVMRQVLIGGRLGDTCPNNLCPDFTPIPGNITLAPGQTYKYSGSLTLGRSGSYTFYVAYQKPDGSWAMPVDPENGTTNRLSITVQSPGGTLTGKSPAYIGASPKAQTVYLSGIGLGKTVYCRLQLPNGSFADYWILPWEIFSVRNDQLGIKIKFTWRGTYHIQAKSKDGSWSNVLPLVVN